MTKTTVYRVEGTEVFTLKEVAGLLGVTKVTMKDLREGKYPNVEMEELVDETPVDEALTNMEDVVDQDTVEEDEVSTNMEEEDTDTDEPEDTVEYPEVGTFKTKKELQKYYKKLTVQQLEQWADLEGVLANVKVTDHEGIWRMRVAMAILYLHFPKESGKKSKSKYGKYSLEDLVKMAADAGVEYREVSDERILRMYVIMSLRNAGLLA